MIICPVCGNEMQLILSIFDPVNIVAIEDAYCTQCNSASTTYYNVAGDQEIVETMLFLS